MNNDGQIDAYDQTYISRGDVPTTVYGFGFTVGWKDLSVGMMFQGVAGAERVLNGSSINPFNGGGGSGNLYSNIDDRWTPENPRQDVFWPFIRVCLMEAKQPVALITSRKVPGGCVT